MNYPPNLHYGSGIFRRRIAISRADGSVNVELEDCNHAFRLHLHHNGATISSIDADAIRYPLNTCGSAPELLSEFIGMPLVEGGRTRLRKRSCPRNHCTHLYDMLALAIAQVDREASIRTYDVVVPDFHECGTVEVYLDGGLVHQWIVSRTEIIKPTSLKGHPLASGFSKWAQQAFSGDHLEAAYVLQMGIFTAQGRRFDIDAMAGASVAPTRIPLGSCYSYQPGRIQNAVRCSGSVRDFTVDADLLKFV